VLLSMGNSRSLGDDSPVLMIGLIVLSVLLFLCLHITGTMEYYGMTGWAKNSRAMLWFIPLWMLSTINIWSGFAPDYKIPGLIYAAVMMAFVGFVEELIFRGFLFRAMLKDSNAKTAVIVSSITFGAGHIVNLLSGHEITETLIQMAFAIVMGFVFTMVYYKGGSLLPGILAHSIIDVTSVFASGDHPLLNTIIHIAVFVISATYCVYLAKRVETPGCFKK